jgi:hypothetical protein
VSFEYVSASASELTEAHQHQALYASNYGDVVVVVIIIVVDVVGSGSGDRHNFSQTNVFNFMAKTMAPYSIRSVSNYHDDIFVILRSIKLKINLRVDWMCKTLIKLEYDI